MADPLSQEHCQDPDKPSSRVSAEWAGWHRDTDGHWTWKVDKGLHGSWEQRLSELSDRRWQVFSWLSARALLDSANDQIAKNIGDLVDPRRQRWVAAQRAAGQDPDTVLIAPGRSFMIVGDPGEIDASQFAVLPPLENVDQARETKFLVVLSDVIYPAGDVNDYPSGFYQAFEKYGRPIYGLPGNHDWYDGLNGFMWNFCGAEALPPTEYRTSSFTAGERAARLLWRRASRPNRPNLQYRRSPQGLAWASRQPGPYWAMDIDDDVRLIAIDTGIVNRLDREQAAWLLRMAEGPRRKVLLTGKPLWDKGEHHAGEIDWGKDGQGRKLPPPKDGMKTVDDIVRHRDHHFRAAIGGDVHNYQRTTVTVNDRKGPPRRIEYVVTGGGGAYMSETHGIDVKPTDLPSDVVPPTNAHFRCYPTRADSLAYYTRWYGRRIVVTCLLAAAAAAGALIAEMLWDLAGPEIGGQDVSQVARASVLGVLGVAAIGLATGLLAWRVFGRGARVTGFLLLAPAAYAGAALLASTLLESTWDWAWKAVLIGLGALLLPVVVIVVNYYGFWSPLRRRLGLAVLAAVVGGLLLVSFDDAGATVATIAIGLAVVALLLRILEPGRELVGPGLLKAAPVSAAVTIAIYHAPFVAALIRYDGAWALEAGLAAELGLVFVIATVVLLLVVAGGRDALFHMARGRLDPDDAMAVLRGKGIEEALFPDLRQGIASTGAQSIMDFLTSPSWLRKLGRTRLQEIGNADTPPMFKNFVRAEVSRDSKTLELTCYGVTGWAEHETNVPIEDCVRVDLN